MHFDIIFMNFHDLIRFLGPPKMSATAHVEIEVFFAYRDGYTQKMASNPRTYVVVLKKFTYEAAHMVFSIN